MRYCASDFEWRLIVKLGFSVAVCLCLCLPGTLPAKPETPKLLMPDFQPCDEIVTSGIQSRIYPGAVLVIGNGDHILYEKAYGHYTYDADARPMSLDTLFDMASCTKVVGTATAAMALIEDGKLSVNDQVAKYIPQFASGGKEKDTVKDLMTHVSGLPAYANAKKVEETRTTGTSTADAMIQYIAKLKTIYPPRTKVVYSCLNMQTMARVNETILKGRMDDFLKKRVYGPLGMNDTVYLPSSEQKQRCAPTLRNADGTYYAGEIHDPIAHYHSAVDHCPGNAGLFSTGPDLARFCGMILGGGKLGETRVFKPETIAEMTRVQTPDVVKDKRGLGFDVYSTKPWTTSLNEAPDKLVVGHTGYTGTLIWLDKLSKTYVVFLTNRTLPNGANPEDGRLMPVRRSIVSHVMHQLPQYQDVLKGLGG
jgi:CubicO group peptidase (beta-lactamase class C family)